MAETEKERPREAERGRERARRRYRRLPHSQSRGERWRASALPPSLSLSLRLSIGLRGAAEPVAFAFTVPRRGARNPFARSATTQDSLLMRFR